MRLTTTSLWIALCTVACFGIHFISAAPTNGQSANGQQIALPHNNASGSVVNPRKRPAPDDDNTEFYCPTPNCGGMMHEFISGGDHRRRYLKCRACEAFRWKDESMWCDREGNWHGNGGADMVDAHYANPYVGLSQQLAPSSAEATTEHALRSQELSQINEIIRDMHRTGEWARLPNELKFAYLEQQSALWLQQRGAAQ